MRSHVIAMIVALLMLPAVLGAQPAVPRAEPVREGMWEFNIHAATLLDNLFEESGGAFQGGVRLLRNTAFGLGIGANFDYVRTSDVRVVGGIGPFNASILLYSAEIDYAFPVSPRADFFLGAGVGGASVQLDGGGGTVGIAESSTGLLIPLAVGFKLFNRPVDPSWAFRFDVRDNIILRNTSTATAEGNSEPRNNFELSAGFSFLFGEDGAPERRQPAADRPPRGPDTLDTDGDRIVDARDQCPATPPGTEIDSFGCPAPADAEPQPQPEQPRPQAQEPDAAGRDTDRDGVPDSEDRCVNTPSGARIDAAGCPVAEPRPAQPEPAPVEPAPGEPVGPASACVDGREWYRARAPIQFRDRSWQPLGGPEPISIDNLQRIGSYDGVPVLVGAFAEEPYRDLWLPLCTPVGSYQLYSGQ